MKVLIQASQASKTIPWLHLILATLTPAMLTFQKNYVKLLKEKLQSSSSPSSCRRELRRHHWHRKYCSRALVVQWSGPMLLGSYCLFFPPERGLNSTERPVVFLPSPLLSPSPSPPHLLLRRYLTVPKGLLSLLWPRFPLKISQLL